jgi:hypothetical protein
MTPRRHARALLPAALASVPFGFVLVRVRVPRRWSWSTAECICLLRRLGMTSNYICCRYAIAPTIIRRAFRRSHSPFCWATTPVVYFGVAREAPQFLKARAKPSLIGGCLFLGAILGALGSLPTLGSSHRTPKVLPSHASDWLARRRVPW